MNQPDPCVDNGTEGIVDQILGPIVESLCAANNGLARSTRTVQQQRLLPSRDAIIGMMEDLRFVLFPGYFGASDLTSESMRYHVGVTLDRVIRIMRDQVKRGYCFVCDRASPSCPECDERALQTTGTFMSKLPEIRQLLAEDVEGAYEGDPAATCPEEAIFCYPGVMAITNHRIAHQLQQLEVPILPRIISEQSHSTTGIDIHPGASIGRKFFIDHGTGVVIGETCVIGNTVRIYQGVTLGAKSFPLDEHGNPIKGIERHPIVEDDVIIYSGATILGRVTIGRGSVIGGNVWLTRSVPAGSRITQAPLQHAYFEQGAGI